MEKLLKQTFAKRAVRSVFLKFLQWFFEKHIKEFRVIGIQFYNPEKHYLVVAAPHRSHADTAAIQYATYQTYGRKTADDLLPVAARDYFFSHKALGWFFSAIVRAVPFERRVLRGKAESVEGVAELLKEQSALMFPQGARRADNSLEGFQPGVGEIALRSKAEVIPCFLEGAGEIMPKGMSFWGFLKRLLQGEYKDRKVVVRLGEPFIIPPYMEREEATKHIREAIRRLAP